jgi:hypothetical protein
LQRTRPFPRAYLDRGTPGSLLMAFSRSENNWVTSTEVFACTCATAKPGHNLAVSIHLSPSGRERLPRLEKLMPAGQQTPM